MALPKEDDNDVASDSDQSFHSVHSTNDAPPKPKPKHPDPQPPPLSEPPAAPVRFSPEEEASLLASSQAQKTQANALFGKGSYENALQQYDQALSTCPNYLDYEIAVLYSNIAACNLKWSEWSAVVDAVGKGLACLERLEPLPEPPRQQKGENAKAVEGSGVEEVDDKTEARMQALQNSGHSLAEVRKLQTKLLMRRARAKTELAGWSNLQAASEDYTILLSTSLAASVSPTDKRSVLDNQRALTPRLNKAKEEEMAEMMGKLKGLGNGLLKPFGLSTDMFKFVKDEKSGGYSMNFDQGAGKK